MAARIPREHRVIFKLQLVDDMLQPAGMFVAAMEQHNGFVGMRRRPVAVKQLHAVVGGKKTFFCRACHGGLLFAAMAERARL
jgi:hypothetical protein